MLLYQRVRLYIRIMMETHAKVLVAEPTIDAQLHGPLTDVSKIA